jgi:hypothetical protein
MTSWSSSFRTEWWLATIKCYPWPWTGLCEKRNKNSYSKNGAGFLDSVRNEPVQITVE